MEVVEEGTATGTGQPVAILEGDSAPRCSHCGHPMLPAAFEDGSGSEIRLRCFVRQDGSGKFIAECIDLDLATEADTQDAAIIGLGDSIVGYLMVVLDGVETEEEAPAAVLRPSPLLNRARYHVDHLKYRFLRWLRGYPQQREKFYNTPFDFNASQCRL